jgi:hypothetical protein
MLNNKKNLLQRVRIAMVAIVAIMSIGGAFAMKAPEHKLSSTYGVASTDPTYYHVTAATNYTCDTAPTKVCTITTSAMPDSQGRIPKSQAEVNENGSFRKLP